MKKILVLAFCLAPSLFFSTLWLPAQQRKPEITIKDINVKLEGSPRYELLEKSLQPASGKWVVIEAELESTPEWVNEATVTFYVAANYGANTKAYAPPDKYDILTASVTIVNMPGNVGSGNKNIVPMFIDSRTVKKYDQGNLQSLIPQVAVQVMYGGTLQHIKWWKKALGEVRFWEQKEPRRGVLLNLSQSPWWPAYGEDYVQVKPQASQPAL